MPIKVGTILVAPVAPKYGELSGAVVVLFSDRDDLILGVRLDQIPQESRVYDGGPSLAEPPLVLYSRRLPISGGIELGDTYVLELADPPREEDERGRDDCAASFMANPGGPASVGVIAGISDMTESDHFHFIALERIAADFVDRCAVASRPVMVFGTCWWWRKPEEIRSQGWKVSGQTIFNLMETTDPAERRRLAIKGGLSPI